MIPTINLYNLFYYFKYGLLIGIQYELTPFYLRTTKNSREKLHFILRKSEDLIIFLYRLVLTGSAEFPTPV